jgi:hypothetical protein
MAFPGMNFPVANGGEFYPARYREGTILLKERIMV